MYPNVSECVKTGWNRPENIKKLRESVEKLRETLVYVQFEFQDKDATLDSTLDSTSVSTLDSTLDL